MTVKDIFVRPSSGLVREVSALKASFYNIAFAGNIPALCLGFLVWYPLRVVAGLPLFSWVLLIAVIPAILYLLCLTILTHAMPRTGGGYVFTSRIIHPLWGWLEGWTTVWAISAGLGYNGWATVYNVGAWFKAGVVISPGWAEVGNWLAQPSMLLVGGVVMFFFLALLTMSPIRVFHNIVSVVCAVGLVSLLIQLFLLAGVSAETFAVNFQKFTGMTMQQVITAATENGYDPTWFDAAGVQALFGYSLFAYIGYTWSTFLGGELRGNIQKNVGFSTASALAILFFMSAVYILPFYQVAGYEFVNAWAYLFWVAPNLAPLSTAPFTTVLVTIARPEAAGLALVAGIFVLILFNFISIGAASAGVTRILFAQTMDRFYPKKLADVNARTHQPMYMTILIMIIGFIFYVVSVLGYSPGATLWYVVALAFLMYLFPAVNCILLKKRRPDIYEHAPTWAKRNVAGLPVMAWIGILWLAFLLPIFIVVDLWGIITGLLMTEAFLSYVFGTGLLLSAAFVAVGLIWYFAAKAYNKRRGIEIDMMFRAIPPE